MGARYRCLIGTATAILLVALATTVSAANKESNIVPQDIFQTSPDTVILDVGFNEEMLDEFKVDIYLPDNDAIGDVNKLINDSLFGILNKGLYSYDIDNDCITFYADERLIQLLDLAKELDIRQNKQTLDNVQFASLKIQQQEQAPKQTEIGVIQIAQQEIEATNFLTMAPNTVPLRYIIDSNLKVSISVDDLLDYFEAMGAFIDRNNFRPRLFIANVKASTTLMRISPLKSRIQFAEGWTTTYEKNKNLRVLCDLTPEQIEKGLGGKLRGESEFLIQMQEKYQVDLAFAVAVAKAETSSGTAGFGISYHSNLYNIRYYDGSYIDYSHAENPTQASIENFFYLISYKYLEPEGPYHTGYTVSDVHFLYAEDPTWADVVEQFMDEFYHTASAA